MLYVYFMGLYLHMFLIYVPDRKELMLKLITGWVKHPANKQFNYQFEPASRMLI